MANVEMWDCSYSFCKTEVFGSKKGTQSGVFSLKEAVFGNVL